MRISDWSSDVCSSDLAGDALRLAVRGDEDDRHGVPVEDAARGIDAVDIILEIEIHEDEIGRRIVCERDRLRTALGDTAHLQPDVFQSHLEVEGDQGLIFDDQHLIAGTIGVRVHHDEKRTIELLKGSLKSRAKTGYQLLTRLPTRKRRAKRRGGKAGDSKV